MNDKVKMMVEALRQQRGQAAMPFPNNQHPDMTFANRWPQQLPPSGILNDLKPNLDPGLQLIRRLPNG